jgi:hypothetical protein
MPKSKHRRKPDGKAVAHPGRGKSGKPLSLDWLRPSPGQQKGVADLPLFDWAARQEVRLPATSDVRE